MPIPRRYKETSLFQKGAIANAINEEVLSAESRINLTTDNITSEVSKITSAKYVNSSTSGWTLANIKIYAAEGYSGTWNISSATPTTNFRVGDIIYVKGTDTTRNCPVYIKTSVTAINSSTQFTGISHGYEDILPVNSIKSTINQSAENIKIQAKHIEIDGTTRFVNSDNTETTLNNYLDTNYDEIGAADAAEQNAKDAIPDNLSEFNNDLSMMWQGTCSTANGTAAKVITCPGFKLTNGASVTVKFSAASTDNAPTLNVNSTGAKPIWVNGVVTSATNMLKWAANAIITFTYDGTRYRVASEPRSWYGTCGTAAGTAAKATAAINEFVMCKGTSVNIQMTNANTVANPTLNISSLGALAIYTAGSRPTANSSIICTVCSWTTTSCINC